MNMNEKSNVNNNENADFLVNENPGRQLSETKEAPVKKVSVVKKVVKKVAVVAKIAKVIKVQKVKKAAKVVQKTEEKVMLPVVHLDENMNMEGPGLEQ